MCTITLAGLMIIFYMVFFNYICLICACVRVRTRAHARTDSDMHRDQKTVFRDWFSPFTMWISGIKFRSPDLSTDAFTCWTISLGSLFIHFILFFTFNWFEVMPFVSTILIAMYKILAHIFKDVKLHKMYIIDWNAALISAWLMFNFVSLGFSQCWQFGWGRLYIWFFNI